MNLKTLLLLPCLLLALGSLQAQCPKGTLIGSFDADVLTIGNRVGTSDIIWAGDYQRFDNLAAGSTYEWDLCDQTGAGNGALDTYLTVFNGPTAVAFDDNSCGGDDALVSYTVPAGVTSLDVQVNTSACGLAATNHRLGITLLGALPVDLVRFFATLIADIVELKWETSAELDSEEFQLERSTDGENWDNIAVIPGHGTTTTSRVYKHIDSKPLNGISYYRLKQMDFNGQFEYSSIVNVGVELSDNNVSFFPNPAYGAVTIALKTGYGGKASLSLFDLSGRRVKTQTYVLDGDHFLTDVDLTGLPAGVYLAELQTGAEKWRKKLVVK